MSEATLVLLPGLDGTDVFLRPLVTALPSTIRCRAVTFPATGGQSYADLLEAVREATRGLPQFYLLGLSFSGPLAMMLAQAEPARIRGVILAATFVRAPQPALRWLRFVCRTPLLWLWRVGRRLPLWLGRAPQDPLRQAKSETFRLVSARCIAARVRAIATVDARAALRSIRCPSLVISFADDRTVPPANVEHILRELPAASHVALSGGHYAGYTNSAVLAAHVGEFISGTEAVYSPQLACEP